MESYRTLTIPPDLAGIRIDRAIAHLIPEYSRTFIQRLIDTGSILINSRSVDKSHTLVAPYRMLPLLYSFLSSLPMILIG
jgi:23S rRNA-/tRNA-specific pseudouridylate synthase